MSGPRRCVHPSVYYAGVRVASFCACGTPRFCTNLRLRYSRNWCFCSSQRGYSRSSAPSGCRLAGVPPAGTAGCWSGCRRCIQGGRVGHSRGRGGYPMVGSVSIRPKWLFPGQNGSFSLPGASLFARGYRVRGSIPTGVGSLGSDPGQMAKMGQIGGQNGPGRPKSVLGVGGSGGVTPRPQPVLPGRINGSPRSRGPRSSGPRRRP